MLPPHGMSCSQLKSYQEAVVYSVNTKDAHNPHTLVWGLVQYSEYLCQALDTVI